MALDPISSIAELATSIISKIWPDKTEQQKQAFSLEVQRQLAETQILKSQSDTNTAEAGSHSILVSGWRPWIGWVCGCSFAWQFVLLPIVLCISSATGHSFDPPTFDINTMTTVLMGMLGLGTMRTFEKYTNTAKNR